jgi:hypothetical protein
MHQREKAVGSLNEKMDALKPKATDKIISWSCLQSCKVKH